MPGKPPDCDGDQYMRVNKGVFDPGLRQLMWKPDVLSIRRGNYKGGNKLLCYNTALKLIVKQFDILTVDFMGNLKHCISVFTAVVMALPVWRIEGVKFNFNA